MRRKSIFISVVVLAITFGAFAAGRSVGQSDERKVRAAAQYNLNASQSAETFRLARSAWQALEHSDSEHAKLVLVRLTARQVPVLNECSSSPTCAAWVGSLMPSMSKREEAVAAESASGDQR